MKQFAFLVAFLLTRTLVAQQTFPVAAPSDHRPGLHAFVHATLYTDYKTRVENATLLIREDKIVAAGQNVEVPADAVVHDCTGKTIYPAFIDLYAADFGLGVPAGAEARSFGRQQAASPEAADKKGAAYSWNEALKPEYDASAMFENDEKAAEAYRNLGFGALLTHRADGICRGSGALVMPAAGREHKLILTEKAGNFLSFRKGSSHTPYPTSLMGAIALIRQTYLDGQWYKTSGYQEERNLSLDAWNAQQSLPQIFETSDKLDILRVHRISQEFGVPYIVKTAGDEYQRLSDVVKTGFPLIVPLNFPEGYDVRDPYDAMNVSLKELKHWELAPSNPARLQSAGVAFALTTYGLKDKSQFWENLRKAISYGLDAETALKALTWNPASFIHVYDRVGSLETGKMANFIIVSGDIFSPEGKIMENWCDGTGFDVHTDKSVPKGKMGVYELTADSLRYIFTLKGKAESPEAQLMKSDSSKIKISFSYAPNGAVTLSFQPDTLKKGLVSLSGTPTDKGWEGAGTRQDGAWIKWSAVQIKAADPERRPVKQNPVKVPDVGDVIYPFTAFGRKEIPKPQTVLIRNATVWTSEKNAVLQNTDVLIQNGKIQRIGRNLPVQDNAVVVDGTGKYLTAGIIDEHSHIAISRGINEAGQECTAEVRIGDVLDCEDVDIYRQLAGGVTSSHILHGSANPIDGQTQLIKLR